MHLLGSGVSFQALGRVDEIQYAPAQLQHSFAQRNCQGFDMKIQQHYRCHHLQIPYHYLLHVHRTPPAGDRGIFRGPAPTPRKGRDGEEETTKCVAGRGGAASFAPEEDRRGGGGRRSDR